MGQDIMNKKLFPIDIPFKKVTLILEICGGGFVHVVCAACQLESKKQNQYPINKCLLVHSYHPFHFDGGRIGQVKMKKKLPSILIIQCSPLIGRSRTGRVLIPNRPTTCQLECKKQKDYPQKEFLFIHFNHLHQLIVIIRFVGFKVMQDSMAKSRELVMRVRKELMGVASAGVSGFY